MPSASDYQFESALESAVRSLLTSAGLDCATARSEAELVTPRAEIRFNLSEARQDTISGNPTDGFYHAGFNGSLEVSTVTTRKVDGADHMTNVGKVRHALRNRGAFSASILPSHIVNDIFLSGSIVTTDQDLNLDITTDTYQVAFVFR